jgi:hypothetical protein
LPNQTSPVSFGVVAFFWGGGDFRANFSFFSKQQIGSWYFLPNSKKQYFNIFDPL